MTSLSRVRPARADWNAVVTVRRNFNQALRLLAPLGWVDRTGLYNVIALRVDDPRSFLEAIHERACAEPELADIIGHVAPATATFMFTSAEEFEDRARRVVVDWVDELAGRSFHVRMHRRGFKGELSRPREEQLLDDALLRALERLDGGGRITFGDPDAVISVETIRDWAGLALWTRADLARYPLLARAFHLKPEPAAPRAAPSGES